MQIADGVRLWSNGQYGTGLSLDEAALLLSSMSNRTSWAL